MSQPLSPGPDSFSMRGAYASEPQMRLHIPASQQQQQVKGGAAADADSLEFHISQLRQPARSQMLQGELASMYLLLPHAMLQRHPWLQLPWGRKLVRAERARRREQGGSAGTPEVEAALDATVLTRAHPCPHQLHIRLRAIGADEAARHAQQLQAQAQACSESSSADPPAEGSAPDGEDDGADIVHDPTAVASTDSEHEDSSTGAPDLSRARSSTTSAANNSSTSSSAGRSSLTRAHSNSNSTTNASTTTPKQHFAFRKSTLPVPSPSVSHSSSSSSGGGGRGGGGGSTPARRAHHPSRLAPGYSPFHSAGGSGHGGSGSGPPALPVLNHLHSDAHSAPAADSGEESSATRPPRVTYFYLEAGEQQEWIRRAFPAVVDVQLSADAAAPLLVVHLETCLSILPAFLTSPSLPALNWLASGGSSSDVVSLVRTKRATVLALEVELVSPPAPHHLRLSQATLHMPNTGLFLLDNQAPPAPGEPAPPLSLLGAAQSAPPGTIGYANLRSFVAANRALQVPHLIPPAKALVTVVEPLVLEAKSVCMGGGGGGGGGGGAYSSSDAPTVTPDGGGTGADICIEFTLLNASSTWTLELRRLEFLLNRSRIFLKIGPQQQQQQSNLLPPRASGPSSPALSSSPSLPPPSFSSPRSDVVGGSGGSSGSNAAPPRAVHFLPLAPFFPLHWAEGGCDSAAWPLRLAPQEQVNLLAFMEAPSAAAGASGGGKLQALESLVRSLLAASSSSPAAAQALPSFSLATASLPYRTPYSVTYCVVGLGSHRGVSQQNKVMWRSGGASGPVASAGGNTSVVLPGSAPTQQPQGNQHASGTTKSATNASSTPLRLDRWNSFTPGAHPSTSASSALLSSAPASAANALLAAPLKLSLRLRLASSPVTVHRPFPVWITVVNAGTQPTRELQVVLLANSHPIVRESERIRREQEAAAIPVSPTGAAVTAATPSSSSTLLVASNPFSPTSPAPPLLFSPHTPFSPSTPFLDESSQRAVEDAEGSPTPGPGGHFPFQAVEQKMARRHSKVAGTNKNQQSTKKDNRDASASSVTLSHMPRSGGGGDDRGDVLATSLSQLSTHAGAHSMAAGHERASPESEDDDAAASGLGEASYSSVVCLETSVSLGCIPARGERSATLHYLALREGLLSLSTLFVFDPASSLYYRLLHTPTLFAIKQ